MHNPWAKGTPPAAQHATVLEVVGSVRGASTAAIVRIDGLPHKTVLLTRDLKRIA